MQKAQTSLFSSSNFDLFNKHAGYVRHNTLYYVFKATPPFADTSVKNRLCDSRCHAVTIALTSSCTDLKLLQR